jgi:hypothetical protein
MGGLREVSSDKAYRKASAADMAWELMAYDFVTITVRPTLSLYAAGVSYI